VGLLAVASSDALAATIVVNTTNDELAPGDHACSLREAIDTVNSPPGNGDCAPPSAATTIALGSKTYVLTKHPAGPDDNSTGDLNISTSVLVTISGAGKSKTRIDATGLGDRVLDVASGSSLTMQRLTVTGGHAPDGAALGPGGSTPATPGASGGGIRNAGALTLRRVVVSGNSAGDGGAGGIDQAPNPRPGADGGSGGGLENDGTALLEDSVISRNRAGRGGAGGGDFEVGDQGGDGGSGGGILNTGTTTLSRSTVSNNFAGSGGRGGSGITAGAAAPPGGRGGDGGGIVGGYLIATNGTITGNIAGRGGDGGQGAPATIGGGDSPGGPGGAGGDGGSAGGYGTIFAGAKLTNVTISDNAVGGAGSGGAGGQGSGTGPQGAHGANGKPGDGGGLVLFESFNTLKNSIVASNVGGECSGASDGGHNLIFPADPDCPFGVSADPLLKAVGGYGGPTPTMALKPKSPAINKVPAHGAGCPAADQRGVRRPRGPACEIGAYEFARPTITISSPRAGATYKEGATVRAKFACQEAGRASLIARCFGTVKNGKLLNTSKSGKKTFMVTAVDRAGVRLTKTVHYTIKKKQR
jgi:CSLREA domain-containing protein